MLLSTNADIDNSIISLVHSADTDKTRHNLTSLQTENNTRSSDVVKQKISKLSMFSFFQFCPVSEFGVN